MQVLKEFLNYYRSIKYTEYYVKHPRFVFNDYACERKRCSQFEHCREMMQEYSESLM